MRLYREVVKYKAQLDLQQWEMLMDRPNISKAMTAVWGSIGPRPAAGR